MKLESFNTILSDYTSKYNKIKKEDYLAEGKFPIIDQGQKFVGGYTDDGNLITDIEKELIIFGDHTKILKFIDFPIAIGADGVKVLHVNKEKADPRYIYYFLKSVKLTDAGYSRHFKFLKEIKIPVPENIDEQIKIARLLNHVEKLIAQRKESIKLLDKLLESKFYEMFGDPVKNEKQWELVPLSQLGSLDRGVSKHRPRNAPELLGGEYPLIQTGEVSNSGLYITNFTNTYSELGLKQSKIWIEGTLLITIAANIAQTSILTFKACFPDSIVGFVSIKKESNPIFIHYLFRFFQAILEKNAPQSAQKNINLELLRNLLVPKPGINLQDKFASTVEYVYNLKKEHETSLKELENMFGALSQSIFNGDLIQNGEKEENDVKKKSEEVMEQDNLEQYSKSIDFDKEKVDITNMSFEEYYKIPGEVTFKNEKWITFFLNDDLLYQFLLKDNFKDTSFTLSDIETRLHDFFYHTCDMDFDNERWKQIIFKFLEANPPLIEQIFDQVDKIIKLKLTDEAFKA